jgi:membrane protease YdiL (CAAX protease family)
MNLINIFGFDIEVTNIILFVPLLISFVVFDKLPKYISLGFISTFIILAYGFGFIDVMSTFVLLAYGISCYLFSVNKTKKYKVVLGITIFLMTIVLMTHLLQGINNPKIIDDYTFSENAVSFTKYLNIDKAIAGFFLLLYVVPRSKKVNYENSIIAVLVATLVTSISLLTAVLTGMVDLDPKFSGLIIPWALTNLFLTCYTEEAFFRGFIQVQISSILSKYSINHIISIFVSGILFGLVHLSAGFAYTVIASLLGCSFAYIYYKTKNIYWPICAHFIFNLSHFVLFTYPYIKR